MSSEELKVVSFCAYLTDTDATWRQDDYDINKMVKAVKGAPINGFFEIETGEQKLRFDNNNSNAFLDLAAKVMAVLLKNNFEPPVTLVPIPNCEVTGADHPKFRTLQFAKLISKYAGNGFDSAPIIVFGKTQASSAKGGGSRNPYHFEDAMKVIQKPTTKIVLVDDVFTTGSHLIGASWKLGSEGLEVIGAIVFSRATKIQESPAVAEHVQHIPLAKSVLSFRF